jgi:lipoprotein-anchoring transpeptidase ErfK/SrfK
LGRLSDNTWLYVKTSDGQEGWIEMSWVDLAGVNLYHDAYPVTTPSPAPPATIRVSGGRVNLRTGPGTNFSVIRKLTYDEQLLLLGRLSVIPGFTLKHQTVKRAGSMSSVDLAGVNLNHDDYPFRMSPPTETSTPVVLTVLKVVGLTSISANRCFVPMMALTWWPLSWYPPGLIATPQRLDSTIFMSSTFIRTMRDFDYYLPDVPYSMYYSGDFSIHGTYWHHNFGTPMSHGCVNMDTSDAEWLYNWSSIGTLVNIHR